MQITDTQLQALTAMCNAVIPNIEQANDKDGYWKRKASDFDVPNKMIEMVAQLTEEEQTEFKRLVWLLDSRLLGLTWWNTPKKAVDLTQEQRERLLRTWSLSRLPDLRKAYATLKKLTCFIYFSDSKEEEDNPNWPAIQYPGPIEKEKVTYDKYLAPLILDNQEKMSCDVVIVGSGAGGSVMAAELSRKGKKVIVVEKGAYVKEEEMNQRELPMIRRMYERQGALVSKTAGMTIFAGSCVGGGTTINWAGSFRTPDYVLQEWAEEFKNPQFIEKDYEKCFEAIEQRMGVSTNFAIHNPQNQALVDACEKLGYHHAKIRQNVRQSSVAQTDTLKPLSYTSLGDVYRSKQSAPVSFLQDATDNGAIILANTEVKRITFAKGKATGVIAYQTNAKGQQQRIRIKAEQVVVSAGTIHTPALLMRSGLVHPQIGRNLYLHPVAPVSAFYQQPIEGWYGSIMSAVSNEFARLDGNFGFKIESPPLHSGVIALVLPWSSGKQFKEDMRRIRNVACFFPLVRDKFGGQIKLNKKKEAVIHYKLSNYDKKHLLKGIEECIKLHAAAGAEEIGIMHNQQELWRAEHDNLQAYLQKVQRKKWVDNYFGLYSAHQMGTCRMGGNEKACPVKPNGETWEYKNLFVADASAFPRCSGANPMLSIQALAHYIAQEMS